MKVFLMRGSNKAKEKLAYLLGILMKENGKMIKLRDKESSISYPVIALMVILKMAKDTDSDHIPIKIKISILDPGLQTLNKAKVALLCLLEIFIQGNGYMDLKMEKDNMSLQMEIDMLAIFIKE